MLTRVTVWTETSIRVLQDSLCFQISPAGPSIQTSTSHTELTGYPVIQVKQVIQNNLVLYGICPSLSDLHHLV